jgi:NAD-dependent dihydropyrimidine dehydrogenase PreA subunit
MAQQMPGDQPYGIVVNAQIRYADPPEPSMVELDKLDYKPKPIDPEFKNKPDEYPKTGTHHQHDVFAEGIERLDANGNPYPTKLGIHGAIVAVDFEACIADGACMDACPVNVFEWLLNPGQAGTGKDYKIEPGTPEWDLYRTDKSDPVREADCIFCLACETVCPTQAIKIFQP